jgi:hypothetical protein
MTILKEVTDEELEDLIFSAQKDKVEVGTASVLDATHAMSR